MKLPWAMMGSNGKIAQVWRKVCTQIDSKEKLLILKLDSLWKHVGHHKALVAMTRVKGGEYIFFENQCSCYK